MGIQFYRDKYMSNTILILVILAILFYNSHSYFEGGIAIFDGDEASDIVSTSGYYAESIDPMYAIYPMKTIYDT